MSQSHSLVGAALLGLLAAACDAPEQAVGALDEPLAAGRYKALKISTISYAPNSFVIGNVYPGWTDDLTGVTAFRNGPGNPNGATYAWGHIFGNNFNYCAWVDQTNLAKSQDPAAGACGAPQINYDTPLFKATYTDGTINPLVSDGCDTHMHYAGNGCNDHNGYGNVEPWRVPATPDNSTGAVPDGKLLRWRYVTKDGHWVLIHDPGQGANPNWYFVQRGCVSLNPWCGGDGDPCCDPNNACDNGKQGCDNGLVCHGKLCCQPNCNGRCGGATDGCGGACNGNCGNQQACSNGTCVACGGNGQPCCVGACNPGLECFGATCCAPNCNGLCGGAPDGCGGKCGAPCPMAIDGAAAPPVEDAAALADSASPVDAATAGDGARSAIDGAAPPVDGALHASRDGAVDGGAPGVSVSAGCACCVGRAAPGPAWWTSFLGAFAVWLRRRRRRAQLFGLERR